MIKIEKRIRWSIDLVREDFEKEGYKLLSKKYKDNQQKLEYTCPKGHRHSINWKNWHQFNQRCVYCAGNAKKDIDFIRLEFEKEGYQLLATEYKNSKQKLDVICSNEHKFSINWSHWNLGQRCKFCYKKKPRYDTKSIEEVRRSFEREGYTLLTKEYNNNSQKLKFICTNNHRHEISFKKWNIGQRCGYCDISSKKDISFIKEEFKKEGYTLISKNYKDNRKKLKFICPKGHNHKITWHDWNRGIRCLFCYEESIKATYDLKEYKDYRMKTDVITIKNYRKYKNIINPNNLPRGKNKYQIDHIYSVYDGFKNNIPPEILSSIPNLRMLWWYDNISKSKRSSISIYKLYEEYNKTK